MSTTDFNAGGRTGYSDRFFYSDGVALPNGRTMANGTTYALITHLQAFVSGRNAARTFTLQLGSASASTGSIGSSSTPSATGYLSTNSVLVAGGSARFTVTPNGSAYFDHGGTGTVTDGYGTNLTGALRGSYAYVVAPIAPTAGTISQLSPSSLSFSWSGPSDNGGATVTGYRIQYATNSSFTSATTIDVGVSSSVTLSNLTPGLQYWVKVAARNAVTTAASTSSVYSSSKNVILIASIGDLDGWTVFGTLPTKTNALVGTGLRRATITQASGNPSGLLREIQATGSGTVTSGTLGIQRTITNLKIGSVYSLVGKLVSLDSTPPAANIYAFGVVGKSTGSGISSASTVRSIPTYTFTATATSHTIRIILAETATYSSPWLEYVGFYAITLTEIPPTSGYSLADVGLEGSLATHFDLACNSVGGAWWIDRENVTHFRKEEDSPAYIGTFTDVREAGALEYIDISTSYDTRNIVNVLTVSNHVATPAGDDSVSTYLAEDALSRSSWLTRPASIDLTVKDGLEDIRNLAPNPSFELVSTGLSTYQNATSIARSTSFPVFGLWSGRWRSTYTGSSGIYVAGAFDIPATVGKAYTFSLYLRAAKDTPSNLTLQFLDAAGAVLGDVTGDDTIGADVYRRLSVTGVAISGTSYIRPRVVSNTQNKFEYGYIDGVLVTESDSVIPFFDGNSPREEGSSFSWSGTAGNSPSIKYTIASERRAREILAGAADPTPVITSIRWNAQEDPRVAAALDIQDRVLVKFRGLEQPSRVIGLKHTLGPTRWIVDLTLATTT